MNKRDTAFYQRLCNNMRDMMSCYERCAALAKQLALDGRFVMAQHVHLLGQDVTRDNAVNINHILYRLAERNGLAPNLQPHDDDLPF